MEVIGEGFSQEDAMRLMEILRGHMDNMSATNMDGMPDIEQIAEQAGLANVSQDVQMKVQMAFQKASVRATIMAIEEMDMPEQQKQMMIAQMK
jgi:homoserine kinase